MNRSTRSAGLILGGVSAAAFVGPFSQTVYTPSLVEIGHFFAVDALRVNLTISVFVAILAVSGFVVGPLADRYGRRATLLPGLLLFILGSIACLLAKGYAAFLAGRAVQAAGIAAAISMAPVIIGDVFAPEQRARAMNVYQLVTFLGPVAGPVVGGLIAAALPWQWAFALLAAAGMLVLVYNAKLLPETLPANTELVRPSLAGFASVLVERPARTIFVLGFAQFYGYYTFLVFLPGLLDASYGMPVAQRGLAFVPLTAGVLLGIVAHRWIGTRGTQHGIVVAASAAGAIVTLLLGLLLAAGELTLPVLLALLFTFGASIGVSLPAQSTILVDLFGARRATAVGLYTTLRFGGAALGPLLVAWIEPLFGRGAVLLTLALTLSVAAWLVGQSLRQAADATARA